MSTKDSIREVCRQVEDLLVSKNEAYGDAALHPLNVFSKLGAEDGIKVRLDDKLKRIQNSGLSDATEDTLLDVVGYLILLIIKRNESHHLPEHLREGSPTSHQPIPGTDQDSEWEQLHPYHTD